VQCPLDFFPGGATSIVVASARVDQLGDLTARASVVSSPADSDPSDDTAGLTVHVGAPSVVSARGGNAGGRSAGSGAMIRKVLVGTARNDTLVGTAKADRIDGGRGNDRINGREGNDRLVGGPGKDTILGGAGNDVILARDGERDVVDCGAGKDSVTADRKDVVSRNCELVHRR
jgi:Ca2+-binding RTX toxin-like protein